MFGASELIASEARGMATSYWATRKPDAVAVRDRFGNRTFREVNAAANRIVGLLRANGVGAGAHIAFLSSNRAEVMEIMAATLRGGYRLVPVNWHLTTGEVAYILKDSQAKAFFVEARFPAALAASRGSTDLALRVSIGGEAEEHVALDLALRAHDPSDISNPVLGSTMFYTSGTTGRPKGVFRPNLSLLAKEALTKYDPQNDVQLCAGPTYHGAPLTLETRTAMTVGVPVVYMDKWDSLEALSKIQDYRITHMHMVPIMFQRLLAVPETVRASFDLTSLKNVLHGAAPCPPEIKRAMIDWLGPIIHEYYAGTEGGAGFGMSSEEWLKKPGSVGKRPMSPGVKILDETGSECAAGTAGTIFFERPQANGFSYFNDPVKTESSHVGAYFTLGDIGYFDEDDYLFLTGRTAECIISGGVNIYPQEIDNALVGHPAVEDCATVGVPNDQWGEEVKAVVVLRSGWTPSDALATEIIAVARACLAGYKTPRSVDFVGELPRNAAGKIERHKVRAPYWTGRAMQI
jgi:long-chain acyl-CoA synthetase